MSESWEGKCPTCGTEHNHVVTAEQKATSVSPGVLGRTRPAGGGAVKLEDYPDDEEVDLSRRCTRHNCDRPRWSKDIRCVLCANCASAHIRKTKAKRQPEGSFLPERAKHRERYRMLRNAGATWKQAAKCCESPSGTAALHRRLLAECKS